MIKKVYLIFKTHLDIGFTDTGENVANTYLTSFIPNAVKRGYELKDTDTPYIWTTGSWLINEGLKRDSDGSLDKAIRDGIISWHAMPFTLFSESMSPALMEYALSISDKLDKKYGRKTSAAKMSDVPGHTKAIIPYLAKQGVKFLHLGINPAFPLPDMPPVFRWKNGKDEITVMYQHSYGSELIFDDFVIAFGFTNDNNGPQSVDEIKNIYSDLRNRYPDAEVKAATLNDVAEAIDAIKGSLPATDAEIGDLWVQNIGTDPQKVSIYKELLRHIDKNGITADISDTLLVIPEHTWGGDVKKFFPDYIHYTPTELASTENEPRRKALEKTWSEKRELLDKAQKLIGTNYEYTVTKPCLDGYAKVEKETDFEISWQLFDNSDYERFLRKCTCSPQPEQPRRYTDKEENVWGHGDLPIIRAPLWVTLDNCKYGLPDYKGGIYTAKTINAYEKDGNFIYEMGFDANTAEYHGLPEIWAERTKEMLTVKFFGQKANRLPQAYWLKLKGLEEKWEINKIGQWLKTDAIVNPYLMGTYTGVRNPSYKIELIDSMLAAPHGRMMLDKSDEIKEDMYFNLYNNTWGCNQPMWYGGDSIFRFRITER